MTAALHLFLETLMTVNEIAPSCVSLVADNAQAQASPKRGLLVSKSRKRTALDSCVHKGKSRWSAIALPSRRADTMIETSVSDSVLSRPKRATSPEREIHNTNASWADDRNCRSSTILEKPRRKKTSSRAERTWSNCDPLPSLSPDHVDGSMTNSSDRGKLTLYKNILDYHMPLIKNNFQGRKTTLRNAAA
jgi:hypothetical protein